VLICTRKIPPGFHYQDTGPLPLQGERAISFSVGFLAPLGNQICYYKQA
jgi:hypothetical protein